MSLTPLLAIAGTTLQPNSVQDGWSIQQNFGRQGDTATFTVRQEHPDSGPTLSVQPLQAVSFYYLSPTALIFAGLVAKVTYARLGPNLSEWQVACRDNTWMMDAAIVGGAFPAQTADVTIKALVAQAGLGINVSGVMPGPLLAPYTVDYKPLSTAIREITDLASSGQVYGWYLDQANILHWFNASQAAASGIVFTDGVTAPATSSLAYYEASSLRYEWDASTIRTRSTVWGGIVQRAHSDTFTANGASVTWPMAFPPSSSGGVAPTISIAGTAATVSVLSSGGTSSSDYVLAPQADGTWQLQLNRTNLGPPSATISYTGGPTGATLTDTAASFPTAGAGLAGRVIAAGTVWGVATSNTATVVTLAGGWKTAAGAAGATPVGGAGGVGYAVGAALPTNGQQIILNYEIDLPIVGRADNAASEALYSTLANKGVFENLINSSTIVDAPTAQARAQADVSEYGVPQERVTFTVTEDWGGHLRAGQLFTFVNAIIPDSVGGYAPGINGLFLAMQVGVRGVKGNHWRHTVTAVRV